MFFNTSDKDPDFKPLKPVIDIRDAFQKGIKEVPDFVENNKDIIEKLERDIPIEQSDIDRENSREKEVPIRFEDMSDFTGWAVVSQAMAYEKKKNNRKKFMEEKFPNLKKAFFEGVLFILKYTTIFSAHLWQKMDNTVRSLKYGGINFSTRYTDSQLYYMAISIPSTITNATDLLSIFPLMGNRQRAKIIQIRREKLAMYDKIFKKR